MKKRLMILILSLILVLGLSPAVLARGAGNACDGPNRISNQNGNWVPLAQKLNLNDRQVQQLKEINLNTHQTTRALKIKLLDARFELRQLSITGKDRAAMDAKVKEIKTLQSQIHKAHQQKWEKVKTILTPEQQSKLKEMKGLGHHRGHCGKAG